MEFGWAIGEDRNYYLERTPSFLLGFSTREEATRSGRVEALDYDSPFVVFRVKRRAPSELISASELAERIIEMIDEGIERDESWSAKVKPDAVESLRMGLDALVNQWARTTMNDPEMFEAFDEVFHNNPHVEID